MTAPLVPANVNLRGLPWMRLDTSRLLDSDLFALSSGDEFKAALALWCKSWTQMPAGSLPKDDRVLAHLSGAGVRWGRVKEMALRGWFEADDGRLYHPVVAEQALAAWEERQEFRAEVESQNERKRRERAARAAMFEILNAAGHSPAWNTPTGVLRDLIRDMSRQPVTLNGTNGAHNDAANSGTDTHDSVTGHGDSHGLDGTGRDGTLKALPPDTPPARIDSQGARCVAPTAAGAICAAMRSAGLARANPGAPNLHAAIAAGCTTAEFVTTTHDALRHAPPKGFAWIVATTLGRRRDATNGAHHATATSPRPGESLTARSERINRELDERERGNPG